VNKVIPLIAFSVLLLVPVGNIYALNPAYTYTLVASEGDTIDGKTIITINNQPSMNNNGDIVFHAGAGPTVIFTPTTAIVEGGDVIAGKTLSIPGFPQISDSGVLNFLSSISGGGQGIFTPTSLIRESGEVIGGKTVDSFNVHSASDNGNIVFVGNFAGGKGVFTPTSLLTETGLSIGGKTITNYSNPPTINNFGDVVFKGEFAGGTGIFTPTSLIRASGDVVGGKTLTVVWTPGINNLGEIAFCANYVGGFGVFTPNLFIAGTGDVIGGKTLVSPVCHTPVLNDNGDIVFLAQFDDGSKGIVLAQLDQVIGGEILPINTSALLLAGAQSISMWMIPVVIAGAGIGVFVIKRRR